jgi:formylglycine-generating enzyme required for sulfatase activity
MCAKHREPDSDNKVIIEKPRGWQKLATNAAIFVFFAVLILIGVFVVTPWVEERVLSKELERAAWLVAHGPMEEAVEVFDGVIRRAAPNSTVYRRASQARDSASGYVEEAMLLKHEADDAYKSEDYVKAMGLYQRISERYPLSQAGRTSVRETLAASEQACRKHEALGKSAMNEKRWFDAKGAWEQVLALEPEYPGAQEGLKRTEGEIVSYERMLSAGQAAAKAGRWPESRSYYERALDLLPASAEAYEGRTLAIKNIPPPEGMVLIEPGDCILGPGEGRPEAVTVRMNGFYMGATEVTNEAYAKFVLASGHEPPPYWPNGKITPDVAQLPVICVSWHDAAAYAAWAGKRLPSADEWERAARGREGKVFPWGSAFSGEEAIYWFSMAQVAAAPSDRTAEGCFDMGGNVSEWTADETRRPKQWPTYASNTRYHVVTWYDRATFRTICGESWAGLEQDRPGRFVMKEVATPATDPREVAFVDKAGLFGATSMANCDTFFLLRVLTARSAVFELRKWLEEEEMFVALSASLRPGEWIRGTRTLMLRRGPTVESTEVELDTRWKFIGIAELDGSAICESFTGLQVAIRRSTQPRMGGVDYSLPRKGTRARNDRDDLLAEVGRRPLWQRAISMYRRGAPEVGKYINVGFRCVKDL